MIDWLNLLDWPNLLVGSALALLVAYPFHRASKRDYARIAEVLEKLEQQKAITLNRDEKGKIIAAEPIVLTVEPAKLGFSGSSVECRIDEPGDDAKK